MKPRLHTQTKGQECKLTNTVSLPEIQSCLVLYSLAYSLRLTLQVAEIEK